MLTSRGNQLGIDDKSNLSRHHGGVLGDATGWRVLCSGHKYKIGQSVQFTSGPFGRGAATGIYKVTQLLPPEGDEYQYRIKSANEPHERVVKESQMDRVA